MNKIENQKRKEILTNKAINILKMTSQSHHKLFIRFLQIFHKWFENTVLSGNEERDLLNNIIQTVNEILS